MKFCSLSKHLVQLDWVSTEDGSHILTVGVGSKILMYGQVSNDIVQACQKSNEQEKKTICIGRGGNPSAAVNSMDRNFIH
jgi:hypothetical protein